MLGYLCNWCARLITVSKIGQKRDCPHCHCPAKYTVAAIVKKEAVNG